MTWTFRFEGSKITLTHVISSNLERFPLDKRSLAVFFCGRAGACVHGQQLV